MWNNMKSIIGYLLGFTMMFLGIMYQFPPAFHLSVFPILYGWIMDADWSERKDGF